MAYVDEAKRDRLYVKLMSGCFDTHVLGSGSECPCKPYRVRFRMHDERGRQTGKCKKDLAQIVSEVLFNIVVSDVLDMG